jgi:hypothetical protein
MHQDGGGKPVDPVLDATGVWGTWQTRMFFVVGMFLVPGTFQILILTFVNGHQVNVTQHLRKSQNICGFLILRLLFKGWKYFQKIILRTIVPGQL